MDILYFTRCVILNLTLIGIAAAQGSQNAKVLVVHSYEKEHVCGAPQASGIVSALHERGWMDGKNMTLKSYYMDTKKTHTSAEAIRQQAQAVLQTVEDFKPDVVVVLDDNAIREVMLPLVNREDIAVVFTGMNGQPENYNEGRHFMESREKPGSNITGVYEKLHVSKSLMVMEAALSGFAPEDKVIGITDYSPTGNAISRQFELELAVGKKPVTWELHRVKDFAAYQALINRLNADNHVRAIYPAALSLKTRSGETYTAPKIFAWTTANSRNPEMALNYHFAKIGLFGGAAVDFTAMGKMAGEKVASILAGETAGNLPIEEAPDYAIVFNLERAKELGISIPEGLLTAADFVYHQ